MKKMIALIPLILGGCATGVYHPTKPASAMQADIDQCTEASTFSDTVRVAVMEDVVACLKTKGYVNKGSLPAAERPRPAAAAPKPCAVPCGPER